MNVIIALALVLIGAPGALPRETDARAQWISVAVSDDGNCQLEYQVIGGQVEVQCRMGGRERWRRQLALVPEHGFVSDDGAAVLTGTRQGRSMERGRRQSYFVIAILDIHGQLLQYQHVMQRLWGCSRGATSSRPRACGLIVDTASDVAVVRVLGGRRLSVEWWWLFRLSNGELLGDLHPWDEVDPEGAMGLRLRDARVVPGQQLVVTLWSSGACAGGSGASSGDILAVLGLRGADPVVRPLEESGRSACAFLESVTRDAVQLRSLNDRPYALAISQENRGLLKLTRQ